jgi:hypothetical protein
VEDLSLGKGELLWIIRRSFVCKREKKRERRVRDLFVVKRIGEGK